MIYEMYTDGATSNNGYTNAIGGWAFIVLSGDKEIILSGSDQLKYATNNICELTALIKGCQAISSHLGEWDGVKVYSDSAYCINCANEKWYNKWRQNGWINSSKKPVLNKELWEQLIPFFDDPRFKWIKVKGHSNDKYNNIVDSMAVNARLAIVQ